MHLLNFTEQLEFPKTLKHVKAWLNFLVLTPREDKAVFLLRPCILILKVTKTFEKLSFEALNQLGLK